MIGVPGLDLILGRPSLPGGDYPDGTRLLIRGLPGTGKTTMALHLLHGRLHETAEPSARQRSLIVTFGDSASRLDSLAERFGLDFHASPPDTARLSVDEFPAFPVLTKYFTDLEPETPCTLLIDGLSILKSTSPRDINSFLALLLETLERRNLLSLIVADEDIVGADHFFEHLVDGVFQLSVDDSPHRHRFFEISKLRDVDYVRGRHGLDIYSSPDGKSVLRIYPSPRCHALRFSEGRKRLEQPKEPGEPGIKGLREIVEGVELGTKSAKPLFWAPRDVFVVTAEPGTEKVGFGLSFLNGALAEGLGPPLWASFGPTSIGRSLERDPYASRFRALAGSGQTSSDALIEVCVPVDSLHPDRAVDDLVTSLKKRRPSRVVIDGLSTLARELNDANAPIEYLTWLVQILRRSRVKALVFIDLPLPFQPIGDVDMAWEGVADFVGHLRWFEINNHLTMSFSLTKSRFPAFQSAPHYIEFAGDKDSGMSIENRGWPMVTLLSGQNPTIREGKVFLKFFDQNYSSREIHGRILDEFKTRYTSDQTFTHVHRGTPSPQHWSFRGYSGAGHSNTKIVCLKQYIMRVLEQDGALTQFPKDEWELYRHLDSTEPTREDRAAKAYSLWGLAAHGVESPREGDSGRMIPLFADIGTLCAQMDRAKILDKARKESSEGLSDDIFVPTVAPTTWNEMFQQNAIFKASKRPPWIENLFALPDITTDFTGFMAFFLEILVDFGYWFGSSPKTLAEGNGFVSLVDSDAFDETIGLLRRLVREGVSKSPLERIHYHTAYYARRWFSKVDQYPPNDPRLPDVERFMRSRADPDFDPQQLKLRFALSVHALPSTQDQEGVPVLKRLPGTSCLEIYSVGVIRGALAPETAFMFISELAQARADIERFQKRRGLPILRQNWAISRANDERSQDALVIDRILDSEKIVCNFWIPQYWEIEVSLKKILERIFIGVRAGAPDSSAPVADLREQFLEILRNPAAPS